MKLGSSLRRSRRKKARRSRESSPGLVRGRIRMGLGAAGLAVVGWVLGYVVTTRMVFPAPPPPADLVAVPDLRGERLLAASEMLAATGLALGAVDSLRHPSAPADLVLGQSPLPGQLALPGTPITVTRSAGPQTRPVPDVVNVDASRALVMLEISGFVVLVDSVDSDIPRGRVTSSQPAAGAAVSIPARIRLAVSRGPGLVPMPYLVGLEEVRALAVLDSVGLVLGSIDEVFRPGREQGIVVEQAPPPDSLVERGTAVRLAVARRGG